MIHVSLIVRMSGTFHRLAPGARIGALQFLLVLVATVGDLRRRMSHVVKGD